MSKLRSRLAAVLAVVLVGSLLAACGDDDDGAGEEAPEEEAFDPNGVLKVGDSSLAAGSTGNMDPIKTLTPSNFNYMELVYDQLLRNGLDGELVPGLAKSATVEDPTTLSIELNPGIKFSDGTPLDAEAVKFSFERSVASRNAGAFRSEMYEISAIEVTSSTELTVRFKSSVAGTFYRMLGQGDTMVVSPTAVRNGVDLATNPVGAGPFLFDGFTPSQVMRFKKNPSYFQEDQIKLAGIEFVYVAAGPPQVNGLLSSAIHTTPTAFSNVPALSGDDAFEIYSEPNANSGLIIHMCKSRPPFDDVRVRKALNYAVDRDALNEALYNGESLPMWGFWPEGHPLFSEDLDGFYDHDPDQAKELLEEAGVPNLSFTVYISPGDAQVAAEVLQQQFRQVGVTMTLEPYTDLFNQFFRSVTNPAAIFGNSRQDVARVLRTFTPGNIGNVCNFDDPKIREIALQVSGSEPGSDEEKEYWDDLQEQMVDADAIAIFLVFPINVQVWNKDRVGGVELAESVSVGTVTPDYTRMFIKES